MSIRHSRLGHRQRTYIVAAVCVAIALSLACSTLFAGDACCWKENIYESCSTPQCICDSAGGMGDGGAQCLAETTQYSRGDAGDQRDRCDGYTSDPNEAKYVSLIVNQDCGNEETIARVCVYNAGTDQCSCTVYHPSDWAPTGQRYIVMDCGDCP